MKGLDYIRVESNIAFDRDLEYRSAEAFRMFIELIGTSAYDLTDGKVSIDRAKKLCNCTDFDATLSELEAARLVKISKTEIVIKNYRKYQLTKTEVLDLREKNRVRMTRYRQRSNGVCNGVTNGERAVLETPQSREQSKSNSITPPISPSPGEEFDTFWELYPKKVAQPRAIKAWNAAVKKTDPSVILAGLRRQLPDFKQRDRKYIPHPSTWLNGEEWNNDLSSTSVDPDDEMERMLDVWCELN